ncbi:MAG: hypothetical protein OJF60_001507 [Burkholderiaceae bacterium]|nr:MAG: hypothetical protein OJF60_001507 [Burkholderiaceae bacterium]
MRNANISAAKALLLLGVALQTIGAFGQKTLDEQLAGAWT